MYLVESKGGAIACMLLALLSLGTWPAILTLLERRGRLPQHTYLDYSITNLLAAIIIAFTFGQIGSTKPDSPNFITQLSQNNWPSVMFAMAGGIVLSLGNLATQYAWALVGLSVTEVISSSITVVIGSTLNYFLDDKINRAEILFPGVACFLIAVFLGSAVHRSNANDNKAKLRDFEIANQEASGPSTETEIKSRKDIESNISGRISTKPKEGTASFLIELENKRAIKVFGKSKIIGLAITFFSGLCFSLFSPAFNLATNDQWHTLKQSVPKLVVYTAFFYFSVSCFIIAMILNIGLLYHPVLGLPKSSFKAYLNDWNGRGWALLAGLLCGFGNGLQFMGGQAAGYAAADSVQALPLLSEFSWLPLVTEIPYEDSWDSLKWVFSHIDGTGPENWINKHGDFRKVFLAGDSAGANIAHHLAVRAKKEKLDSLISGIILVHPYFWGKTPVDEFETRDETRRQRIERSWGVASPNSEDGVDDPWINVVGSDLSGLGCGRVLVMVAGDDGFVRQGLCYAAKLEKSGWGGEVEVMEIEERKREMYMIESKAGAITCMLLALLFLGTWPAIMTLTERRGRLPQHTYLDYTITNLLAAVIIAFTLGQIGPSRPNFITQLSQDNWQSVMFAMAGGIVLSLGNLATQYAWAFVGLSVTEVITASITVVIGTTLNYFLDDRINRAEVLFPGVACFLIAVCFGSAVHKSNADDNKFKLQDFKSLETTSSFQIETNPGNSGLSKGKAKEGTAAFLIELEKQRAIKVFGKSTIIGLAITFFAGICFSLFSPAFNLATNDQWHTLKHGVPKLNVYTAFFYFSVSAFVLAMILNIRFLYWPILGLPRSSFKAYVNDWNGRGWSFLAGFLCGFGNGLQFMGGQAAGYAAADAVQALPLVSTFWGILLFGEYRRSSKRTYILLTSMLFMFIVAVAVLMASSGHRK
ncbi:unnamed protein product [Thlaspi arvense]|uniref:Alpha/beta hydrolase fold-3 domain-containing protein n=1 Tax=Thlaspi arvense TaxID=13288 RepID=A0AAU9RMY2_THLAR|nr:unnamed protein product [Thlaspi arvense]